MNTNLSTAGGPQASREEFLTVLKASGLLTPEQLAVVRDWSLEEPKKLALRLVKKNVLTRWQAQQILAGQHRIILGKYKLLEKLGEGGMGAVFKAEHLALKRLVAVKVMNKDVLENSAIVDRFYREIHTVAAVDHPNVIRAYDADKLGNIHLLVMEYVEGHDLKTWLNKCGVLPVAWACECIRQAALGLQHAHEQGLIHRDIKPGNILVVADDTGGMPQAKVLDLGLAKFTTEKQSTVLTQTGICMGTIDYVAPEQAKDSRNVDIRADIYGLGATLFRLITGEVPYSRGNSLEKLVARTTEDPPLASSKREDVPPGLDAVIAKMMSRNPDERYSTPREVAEALSPFALATMDEPCRESSSLSLPGVGGYDLGSIEPVGDPALDAFLKSSESTIPESGEPENADTVMTAPQTGPEYAKTVITAAPASPEYEPTQITASEGEGDFGQDDGIPGHYLALGIGAAVAFVLLGCGFWYLSSNSTDVPVAEQNSIPKSSFVDPSVRWNQSQSNGPNKSKQSRPAPVVRPPATQAEADQLAAATWLMTEKSLNGMEVEQDGRRYHATSVPAWPFKVLGLNLYPAYASPFNAEELSRLRVLTDLESLGLAGQQVSDETLAQLTPLQNLRTLSLNSPVTVPMARSLCRFPHLEWLQVTRFDSETAMQALAESASLRKLNLVSVEVSDPFMKWIKNFPRLTHLHLHKPHKVTEAGLSDLKEAKQLRLLELDFAVPKQTIERLAQGMPWCEIRAVLDKGGKPVVYNRADTPADVVNWMLEEKGLRSISVEQGGKLLRAVHSLPAGDFRLVTLNLHPSCGAMFTPEELPRLSALVDLETLALAGQPVTDEVLSQLASLPNLRFLNLEPKELTPAAFQSLRRFPNLKELHVGNDHKQWINGLDQLPELESVGFYRCSVSEQSINALQSLPKLTYLKWEDGSLSDEVLLQLSKLKQLRLLVFSTKSIKQESIKQLAPAMPWCEIRDTRDSQNPVIYNQGKADGISGP